MDDQKTMILAWMEKGRSITQLEALNQFGCFRLASVIHRLKKAGYQIDCHMDNTNTGKRVGRYCMTNMEV